MFFSKQAEKFQLFRFILCGLLVLCAISPAEQRIVRRETPAPGCRLLHIADAEKELEMYVFTADLRHPGIQIQTAMAGGVIKGTATVASIARRHENENLRIVGAVNGDFFINSQPLGFMVRNGRLIKLGNDWSSITFSRMNVPQIDVFSCRIHLYFPGEKSLPVNGLNMIQGSRDIVLYTRDYGDAVTNAEKRKSFILKPDVKFLPVSGIVTGRIKRECSIDGDIEIPNNHWVLSLGGKQAGLSFWHKSGTDFRIKIETSPDGEDICQALSGGPRIVRNGKLSIERQSEGQRKGFAVERHPRTAVGFSRDKRTLVMVVVDGRQPGYSLGMNLSELGRFMLEQGCAEAMNLDGGGSSTMVVNGEVINRPSDITGPRPVAGALLVGIRLSNTENWN
jgi:hypothetical protein